jgi:PPM family protein phosphatase
MDIAVSSFSHTGRRKNNQDFVLTRIYDDAALLKCLALVADGMGGATNGDTASRIAAEKFSEIERATAADDAPGVLVIRRYILKAHDEIMKAMKEHPELAGMGTTLVGAIVFSNTQVYIANVGDSRAYLVAKARAAQLLTKDHKAFSLERLKQMFEDTGNAAQVRAYSKTISQCLGADGRAPQVDIFELGEAANLSGCAVLLCSDGLLDNPRYLFGENEDNIARTIRDNVFCTESGTMCCQNLASLAYREGSTDNISVCLIEFGPLERGPEYIEVISPPPQSSTPVPSPESTSHHEQLPAKKLFGIWLVVVTALCIAGCVALLVWGKTFITFHRKAPFRQKMTTTSTRITVNDYKIIGGRIIIPIASSGQDFAVYIDGVQYPATNKEYIGNYIDGKAWGYIAEQRGKREFYRIELEPIPKKVLNDPDR